MSHMVIYRGADGKPGYHQTEEIHDAVAFVEELRNAQGVEQARIFRMEEVRFEYQPYFRVQIAESGARLSAAPVTPEVTATSSPGVEAAAPAAAAPVTPAPAASAPTIAAPSGNVTPSSEPSSNPNGASSPAESDNGVGARRGLFGR